MKKIKLLMPVMGLTTVCSALIPLCGCSCNADQDSKVIPDSAFEIVDVTLKGFKEDYDYKNYNTLVIPSNVKVIDYDAFNGLFTKDVKVNAIVFPGNVQTIRKGAFVKNNNITVYDFSSLNVDQIFNLIVQPRAFALDENGIYSFVKMNNDWTDVEKNALKRKLLAGGIPAECFVEQTNDNVELSSKQQKEQVANGGLATNQFDIKGHFSSSLMYKAILTTIDASDGVDIKHHPDVVTSSDLRKIDVNAQMIPLNDHQFKEDDYVIYKITLICYTLDKETGEEISQWSQTLETFKLTYHNVLSNITYVDGSLKTKYYHAGETFDPTGLKINATFSNGTNKEINYPSEGLSTNLDGHIFTYDEVRKGSSTGSISYKLEDVTAKTDLTVSMLNSLYSFTLDKESIKTKWYVTQKFSWKDLNGKIVVYNNDGSTVTKSVTGTDSHISVSGIDVTKSFEVSDVGTHEVTISYTLDGVTKSQTIDITVEETKFNGVTWTNAINAIKTFEEINSPSLDDAKALCLSLGVDASQEQGPNPEDCLRNKLVGLNGELLINNQIHKLSCIDAMHDDMADGTQTSKTGKAALTFQMDTILSDENGNYKQSYWDKSKKNYDYLNSPLRWNLNGHSESGTKPSTGWDKSALEMLPTEISNNIKVVKKQIALGTSHTVTEYTDKLFAPTYAEMSQTGGQAKIEGSPYRFWEDNEQKSNPNEARIKKDVNGRICEYWLATPYTGTTRFVWDIGLLNSLYGSLRSHPADGTAHGISFAFCI